MLKKDVINKVLCNPEFTEISNNLVLWSNNHSDTTQLHHI